MKKQNTFKKVASKMLLHAIEIALFCLVAIWINAVAPEGYAWPAIILLGFVYVVYLGSSLIDDYLDIKGADFMI